MFGNTREAGLITISDPGVDRPTLEIMTVQCVHCGGHFPLKPPKLIVERLTVLEAQFYEELGRKVRGFCQRCNGYVCGPGCAKCVPTEQLLENYEKGRAEDFRPIVSGWTPASEKSLILP